MLRLAVVIPVLVLPGPCWGQTFDPPLTNDAFTPAPMSESDRAHWVYRSTFSITPMSMSLVESGITTWSNSPKEYGSHWDGCAKREATRIGASVLRNSIEAFAGDVWGENPIYRRQATGSPSTRLKYALKMTVMARRESGGIMPAYARFIAIPTTQVLSNTWRPPSETTAGATTMRIGMSFVRQFIRNTLKEFGPDIRKCFQKHS
jgi:hypothetical protein